MNKGLKTVIWIVVIILVVWGLVTLSGKSSTSEQTANNSAASDTIKVGFIGALTGDAAEYGEPVRNAIQMGVDQINSSGGVNGKNIEVIYQDGRCTGDGGANAAQKLVNTDHVQVILGGTCSSETLAAIPIAEPKGTFVITGSATSPALTNVSPLFARDYPSDAFQGGILADTALAKGWKKVAIIAEQTDYAQGITGAFKSKFQPEGTVTVEENFPTATTDFRSMLSKIKVSKPNAILISAQTTASASRVASQLKDLGWKVQIMINDVPGTSPEFVTNYKSLLEGAIFSSFYYDASSTKYADFNEAYKARYNKEIAFGAYTTAVYDSLFIVKDAMAAVGNDGKKISEWIRSGNVKDWQGVSGSVTIGSDGERSSGDVLYVIKNGKPELVK